MKISKRSWHFRMNLTRKDACWFPTNLCGYFWFTVWTMVRFVLIRVALYSLIAFLLFGFIGLPLAWHLGIHECTWEQAYAFWFGGGVTLIAMALILAGVYAFDRASQYKERHYWASYNKPPGLLVSWLKAKKDKVCPIIEYVE